MATESTYKTLMIACACPDCGHSASEKAGLSRMAMVNLLSTEANNANSQIILHKHLKQSTCYNYANHF
jgi:hypothetical protein